MIPDIRPDVNSFGLPYYTKKEYILNPEKAKEKRDFLINLYFSKPDYEESHRKLYYSAYFAAKFAAFASLLELYSRKSRNPTISKNIVLKNFAYLGGSIVTYGAVTTVVANLRGKKDDIFNHLIGGGSVGFIYGYRARSSAYGCIVGGFAALGAVLLKLAYKYDQNIFPQNPMDETREVNFMYGGQRFQDFRLKGLPDGHISNRREHYNISS